MTTIPIEHRVQSDFNGYTFLSKLHHKLEREMFENITLDFSKNTWFDANLCAVLGAIINSCQKKYNIVEIINTDPSVEQVFLKNDFLANFGGAALFDIHNTTIKYSKNEKSDIQHIKDKIQDVIGKPDFPQLSENVRIEMLNSIFEIYTNAFIHTDCELVYSCGQYYPNKDLPSLDLTIVDLGRTIKRNVNEFLNTNMSGIETIEWAMVDSHTTKRKEDNIPGGLGLGIIQQFIELNNGKIQILSADGFVQLDKRNIHKKCFTPSFPGTIITIEFNLNDNSSYCFTYENSNKIEL